MQSLREYLVGNLPRKEAIQRFLDSETKMWATFDPEVGYVLDHAILHNGVEDCCTISTVERNGARTAAIYRDKPCRINTYGNSFTECHQVSDHETWQECLAAHLGEPIRNFGVGGHGVHQAYRRMLRSEQSSDSAEYVILFIWGDDHRRSLFRSRYAVTLEWHTKHGYRMFHGNFWHNIEMDLSSGTLVEKESLAPTPESLYQMTDPTFIWEALKDDLAMQMALYTSGKCSIDEDNIERLNALAEILNADKRLAPRDPQPDPSMLADLLDRYAFAATRHILEKAVTFLEARNKKLLIALLCPRALNQLVRKSERYDQPIVDFLQQRGLRFFDMNLEHLRDFGHFNTTWDAYKKRYFIGHYNPTGNHFFAHSIKRTLVDWLDPKPITYRDIDQALVDFEGYIEV